MIWINRLYNFCSIVAGKIERYFRKTHEHFIIHS
jgi:uncharacterized membrane protein